MRRKTRSGPGSFGSEPEAGGRLRVAVARDACVASLGRRRVRARAPQRCRLRARELGGAGPEPVGDAALLGASGEDDVTRRLRVGSLRRRHGDRERPGHGHGRRDRDGCRRMGRLGRHRDRPGTCASARVREIYLLCLGRGRGDEAERESDRSGEDERVVGPGQVDDTSACAHGGQLRGPPIVCPGGVAGQRERRLHLRRRPRRVALEQQCHATGDVRCRHARPGQAWRTSRRERPRRSRRRARSLPA